MQRLLLLSLLLLVSCGQSTTNENSNIISSSIIGGENVDDIDVVRQSTLQVNDCTATLISENLLVTAAHCVTTLKPGLFKNKLLKNTFTRIWITRSDFIDSSDFIYNANFNGESVDNDIAIIKIPKPLPADKFKPVSILAPEYLLEENTELLLAGYGYQSAKGWSDNQFKNPLQKIKQSFLKYEKNLIIIKQNTGVSGVFHGDSGGPAYLETQTELLLVGATQGAPSETAPTAFSTNVSAYKGFILESAKKLNATAPQFKMPNE